LFPSLVVILGESLANFAGADANDGIGIGVVIRLPAENLDAYGALLQFIYLTIQALLNHILQQSGVALAVAKMRAREECMQLVFYKSAFRAGFRRPTFGYQHLAVILAAIRIAHCRRKMWQAT
jgi:hypothetical protein